MLELTARHADAWNMAWFGVPDDRLAGLRSDLDDACGRVGRDPATLTDTVGVVVQYPDALWPGFELSPRAISGSPSEIADGLAAHAAAGADHLIVVLEPCTPATLNNFAEAVALYRAGVAA
jgi:alkanesulfonate monooxygenase SsuD/methylene tetrahydromethanopterin reductase-like flavin-dependent oxidoreductase (luciferase family)